MNNNSSNIPPEIFEALKKNNITPNEKMKNILNNMSSKDAEKIKSILNDKSRLESILKSEKAKEIMKNLMKNGEKKWKI